MCPVRLALNTYEFNIYKPMDATVTGGEWLSGIFGPTGLSAVVLNDVDTRQLDPYFEAQYGISSLVELEVDAHRPNRSVYVSGWYSC